MNTDTEVLRVVVNPESRKLIPLERPAAKPDWKRVLAEMHAHQAAEWRQSAKFWRGIAAQELVLGHPLKAALCQTMAEEREAFAVADDVLAKSERGQLNEESRN